MLIMNKKIFYRKLVRDKIPEVIKENGGEFRVRILKKEEFDKELRKKVVEEAKELMKARKNEVINELVDILELLKTIARYHGVEFKEVDKYRREKKMKRGGFRKKLFLVWSSEK
jgi:predicted house-cleaning noncanonical NTP pyrophosphatase (MazG superfamily)